MQKLSGIIVMLVLLSGAFSTNLAYADGPIITLAGANPQTIELGAGYTELGAATDDGSPVVIDDSAFVDAVGPYNILYDATDGTNAATQVIRVVNVVLPDSKVTQMGLVIDTLTDLKDKTDDKTDKKLDKVIKKINKAMNSKYWDESGNELTSKKGKKVFDENKKAVKDLSKISKKSDVVYPEIASSIGILVGITQELATDAIDDAQAFAGDKKVDKEIKKSNKEMNKAQKELDKGKPDKAIDKFKKAWEHAQKALKKENDHKDKKHKKK